MSIRETTTISASPQKVVEAYASEGFARHVSQKAKVQFESLTVEGDPAGPFTVTTVRTVGGDRIPDVARKFVKNGVRLTQKDVYAAPAQDGSRSVETSVEVSGIPVSATAAQQLRAEGERTVVDLTGEVTASIPLVGKKISAAVEPYIGKALGLQAREVEAWIRKN